MACGGLSARPQWTGFFGLLLLLTTTAAAQTIPVKLKPENMSFTFTKGDTKLPASQPITVSGTAGLSITVTPSGGDWLTVSPVSAVIPTTLKVIVNPTTLTLGTYSGIIQVTGGGATATVGVTLTVKAPPSTLSVSPTPITSTYIRGTAPPDPVTINLTTSDAVLPFTAKASGGAWLSVTPASGAVFPAFPAAVRAAINVTGLVPGTYNGSVAITSSQAANKSVTVRVTLNVQAGVPVFTGMWPFQITQGAPDTTITLTGNNFYSGSIVKAGVTPLASAYIGPNALTAAIPEELLAAPAFLDINVSNPAEGGGDSADRTFTVLSSAPALSAVVHGATLATGPISPGQIVVFFGTGLGPDDLTVFVPPPPGGTIATSLDGTEVLFANQPAPVIYTSATQVAALSPYGLAGLSSVNVRIRRNGVDTPTVTVPVQPARPGIFTAGGTGQGQALVFNYNEESASYALNDERTPAGKGSIVVFYVTGVGVTTPPSLDGQIVTAVSGSLHPDVAVHIGGADSEILYAGGVVGLTSTILQVNARVPDVKASKATSLKIFVNGIESADGVNLAVK
jgi:uncharacterized protein (TIGR03437 family)